MKMLGDKLLNFLHFLPIIYRNIAMASLAITVALSFIEVIARKVIGVSIVTMNEVGGIGMYIFITFSISSIYQSRGQLAATFLVDRIPAKSRQILGLTLHVLTFVFACLVTYLWWRMFISTFETGRYYLITRIIEWPFHLLATTAWAVLALTAVECFIVDLRQYFLEMKVVDIVPCVKNQHLCDSCNSENQ